MFKRMINATLFLLISTVFIFAPPAQAAYDYFSPSENATIGKKRAWKSIRATTLTADTDIDIPAGSISATDIANPTRSFELPLVAAFLDGTGVMGNDGTTAPGMAEHDNVPAIVWASSGEAVKCQWTFAVPVDYVSSLAFKVILSSSVATASQQSIDWSIWVNRDSTTFDAAAVAQDAVSPTGTSLNASNELITLTMDATGEAAIAAGDSLTIDIWNAGTSDGTTEIKGIQAQYTATM